MPITYSIDHDQKLITEIWTGDIRAEDLKAYWKQYLDDPDVLSIRRTIVDLRRATIHFTGSQLGMLVHEIVLPRLKGKDWKTAIVIEKAVQFGVSRQYQVFAESYSKDAIFISVEDARKWLCGLEAENIVRQANQHLSTTDQAKSCYG